MPHVPASTVRHAIAMVYRRVVPLFIPLFAIVAVGAFSIATSILSSSIAHAQQPTANQSPKVRITGRVLDAQEKKPIKSASVYMKHLGDGSATGDLADSLGRFSVTNAKAGKYHIAISYLGFAKYKDTITVEPNKQEKDLGVISLQSSATKTGEVTVMGEREEMEITPEKKVFNVEKNAAVTGGTAADVLKQVPTVDVDVNGNISVRGSSNLVIQINGKQSGFAGSDRAALLQQIPANLIERVEVITNPSARYDAEGMAGIINIVTKTAITQSWNTTFIAGAGTNDKYNASVDFAYKNGPLSVSAGYGGRTNRFMFNGGIRQEDLFKDRNIQEQTLAGMWTGGGHFGNLNVDYAITENISVNLMGQARINAGRNNEFIDYDFLRSNNELYRSMERDNLTNRSWKGGDVGGGYKQTFSSSQHYLDVSTRFSYNRQTSFGRFVEQELDLAGKPTAMLPSVLNNNFINQFRVWTTQADYVQPTDIGKVETGLKSTLRVIDNDVYVDSLNRVTSEFIPNVNLMNRFAFSDLVLAGYGMLSTKLFDVNVQAGVRAEHTIVNTFQFATNETGGMSYTNLFPTLHLSKKLDSVNTIQMSYSRRINRPNFWQLNPFTDFSNPTLLRKGNPLLMPETIDAIEASYVAQVAQHTITATGYFRRTNNAMQFVALVDSATSVATLTFRNLDFMQNMGFEFIYRGQILPWWNATANLNLFYNSVQGGSEAGDVSAGIVTYNVRLMSSLKMPWDGGNLQVNYMYNGPSLIAFGSMAAWHNLTLGYRQDLSKELSVTLNVTDVLNTQAFNLNFQGGNFAGYARNKPETRIATLNVTYRLGAIQGEQPRRRRDNGDAPQDGGGMGF